MAQVNFYRGENVSLPGFKNGAIYVIAKTQDQLDTNNQFNIVRGDIYVDMEIGESPNSNNTRVHILPQMSVTQNSGSSDTFTLNLFH